MTAAQMTHSDQPIEINLPLLLEQVHLYSDVTAASTMLLHLQQQEDQQS